MIEVCLPNITIKIPVTKLWRVLITQTSVALKKSSSNIAKLWLNIAVCNQVLTIYTVILNWSIIAHEAKDCTSPLNSVFRLYNK